MPSGFTRYGGQVLDAASGKPLQWVCVYAGPPSGCPTPSLVTDAGGRWSFDFPSGLTWPFNFEHPMYEPVTQLTGVTLEVQLKQAGEDYKRAQNIEKFLTRQEVERARTAYQQTQESLRKAQAEVAATRGTLSAAGGSRRQLRVIAQQLVVLARQADEIRAQMSRQEVDIADRVIASPADGRVVMTFVRKGEHVSPGQRIAMFHDPNEIWVEANVKETDIGLLKPGMKAEIRVDAYPGKVFGGEVYRIGQAATNKFALLPDPNPSGNFTKITQRLPVRIVLTEKDHALRPGMMVEVDIGLRNH